MVSRLTKKRSRKTKSSRSWKKSPKKKLSRSRKLSRKSKSGRLSPHKVKRCHDRSGRFTTCPKPKICRKPNGRYRKCKGPGRRCRDQTGQFAPCPPGVRRGTRLIRSASGLTPRQKADVVGISMLPSGEKRMLSNLLRTPSYDRWTVMSQLPEPSKQLAREVLQVPQEEKAVIQEVVNAPPLECKDFTKGVCASNGVMDCMWSTSLSKCVKKFIPPKAIQELDDDIDRSQYRSLSDDDRPKYNPPKYRQPRLTIDEDENTYRPPPFDEPSAFSFINPSPRNTPFDDSKYDTQNPLGTCNSFLSESACKENVCDWDPQEQKCKSPFSLNDSYFVPAATEMERWRAQRRR
jgi:hypothetical protein